jgi:hypothetical protein
VLECWKPIAKRRNHFRWCFLSCFCAGFFVFPEAALAQYYCAFVGDIRVEYNNIGASPSEIFNNYKVKAGYPYTEASVNCKNGHDAVLFADENLNGLIDIKIPNNYAILRTGTKEICKYKNETQTWVLMGTKATSEIWWDYEASPPYQIPFRCRELASPPNLQLIGPGQIRPTGTGGSSVVELVARVTDGAQPKLGVTVNFTVDVTPNSGGHEHHDASRPKGTLSPTQGTTDANGEVKLTFTAPQIAGIHTVKASCSGCTGSPAAKEIQVKVPDLLNIFAIPFRDASWAYPGIGATSQHSDQHYLTGAATWRMLEISQKFKKIWPDASKLTLNDASLVWGGKLDIPGAWEVDPQRHNEHRIGENIDVRANSAPGAVPSNIRQAVFRWLRKTSRPEDNIPPEFVIESVNPLHEGIGAVNEHFHLRLGN